MHEAKLCLQLLDLAEAAIRDEPGAHIVTLRIEVGEWSGVVAEALAAAFPICAVGTRADGAALQIERVAGRDLRLRDLEVTGCVEPAAVATG
jgi:hydrogenase nickel incorporation protein HypA/HybF